MNKMKKIIIQFENQEDVEIEVDGGSLKVLNGIDYDNSKFYQEMESNGVQHITIKAYKGTPEYIDTVTTLSGTTKIKRRTKKIN